MLQGTRQQYHSKFIYATDFGAKKTLDVFTFMACFKRNHIQNVE